MISWRLWKSAKHSTRCDGPCLSESLVIFVESAALVLVYDAILMVFYAMHWPLFLPVMDCTAEISGIAYMLINVRVTLGVARQGTLTPTDASRWAVATNPASTTLTRQTVSFAHEDTTDPLELPKVARLTPTGSRV
ncbi:uncharacterized protein SCHCODRAFT_02509949 [Schizophyllum commune H4-8]|uniref:Expressed protein n=1 Tax=Schizophyllum commune (strain H4-8 / FGSC 9210) TaxID=578458 RepID=D8QC66_SCHCM|nr:uncharacterized protein SCHCODRAFT_02509949 [Schizophyllum commune H4-8]KAI5889457.1 hypothetical protein SCHCODRAFT_02509949 [Schizophyllum commune H4-8]